MHRTIPAALADRSVPQDLKIWLSGGKMMIISGITAIVAAAMGGYKVAMSTIIIGTGAWILRPIVGLFFPLGCAGGIF